VLYANIDCFDPGQEIAGEVGSLNATDLARGASYRAPRQRSELDRWLLSEMQRTIGEVVQRMDAYDNYGACASLNSFVDGVSNWYVRRGRDRYWSSDKRDPDKLDAYWTLYECLLGTAKLMAPFMPFLADYLWRGLTSVFGDRALESVHLSDYPAPRPELLDPTLSTQMDIAREICSKGRAARMEQKLKVRQPLSKVEVILAEETHLEWLQAHAPIIADELNVKQVEFTQEADQYIEYQVRPNFKLLGPRVGKLMPDIKSALQTADPAALMDQLSEQSNCTLMLPSGTAVTFSAEELQIDIHARKGWAAARGRYCVVVLSTDLTPELIREGLARDLIRFVQEQRKLLDCRYTDRIQVAVVTQDPQLLAALNENSQTIRGETLCRELSTTPIKHVPPVELELNDHPLQLFVKVLPSTEQA
jgi:isoleucyl-tRNA synthetase